MLVYTTITMVPEDELFMWGWKSKRQMKSTLQYYRDSRRYDKDWRVTWVVSDEGPRTKAYRELD